MFPLDVSREVYEKKIAELEEGIQRDENLYLLIMTGIVVGVIAVSLIWGRV